MSIGIYALSFNDYNSIYIGQSVNIEQRTGKHISLLKHNKHYNGKLQNMFNEHGAPTVDIIEICSIPELTQKENFWINEFDTFKNGLNLRAEEATSNKGSDHSQAKFTSEQVINAFKLLLDPANLIKDISNVTGVSEGMVSMIACGQSHRWLEAEYPEEYTNLISIKGSRRRFGQSARGKGRTYPPLKAPDGTIHNNISILKDFAAEHRLNYSHLCQLLKGRKGHSSVNGWILA